MATSKTSGINRAFDLVGRVWKMALIVFAIGAAFISISRTWDKIDKNEKEWKEIDDKYNNIIKEMIKDNKAQLDDQRDLIIKNIQRVSELKEKFNEHEISAAEFRGKVKVLLKID